ncbi:hypothetical protein AF332_26705 [Sporosarcina globispora]|uniref:Uncharacterized protein n=1 Tax=Sporosarcina globispora TaxID=1459 RepID=A0A0M0GJL8_SPOGL|nr:hypothetical protein AF332_26705 [Sporosarcina globispora]
MRFSYGRQNAGEAEKLFAGHYVDQCVLFLQQAEATEFCIWLSVIWIDMQLYSSVWGKRTHWSFYFYKLGRWFEKIKIIKGKDPVLTAKFSNGEKENLNR